MKNELRELIRNIIREELQKEDFDSSKGKDVGVHYDTIQHHANQLTNLLPKIKKYSKWYFLFKLEVSKYFKL